MRLSSTILLLAALSFLVLSAGCAPADSGNRSSTRRLVKVDSLNTFGEREVFSVRKEDGLKEGKYQRWSPSGQLLEEAWFSQGKPDQIRILFFENGDTQIVEHYRQGIFHGPYRQYYPQGTLLQSGQYLDNAMTGIWTKYYQDGQVQEEVTFLDNLENGPFREYYPSGVLQVEGNYRNGDKEHGLLKFYDEQGRHIKTMDCQDGLCRTVWQVDEKSIGR